MTAQVQPLKDFLVCLFGPVVWAVHFFVVYGAESIVCLTASSPTTGMRWTIIAVTALSLAAIAASWIRFPAADAAEAGTRHFLRVLSGWLAAISAAAIVAVSISAWHLPACLSPEG
jgi:hypothetical protein